MPHDADEVAVHTLSLPCALLYMPGMYTYYKHRWCALNTHVYGRCHYYQNLSRI